MKLITPLYPALQIHNLITYRWTREKEKFSTCRKSKTPIPHLEVAAWPINANLPKKQPKFGKAILFFWVIKDFQILFFYVTLGNANPHSSR